MDVTGWSRELAVEVGGRGVVNHAGAGALRLIADRTGLTDGLSRALTRRRFTPVHDRGRVFADTAVLIADGGRVLSDMATLRDQAELYGPVASDPTVWRTLNDVGEPQRSQDRPRPRQGPGACVVADRGPAWPDPAVAGRDRDLGKTIVIRMDASLVIAHSDKELAAGTYKGHVGPSPADGVVRQHARIPGIDAAQGQRGVEHHGRSHPGARRRHHPGPGEVSKGSAGHGRRCRRLARLDRPHDRPGLLAAAQGALLDRLGPGRTGTRRDRPRPPACLGSGARPQRRSASAG